MSSSAALSSGVIPTPPAPTVVPPQVLTLDFGAYDMELDPDAIGDSVAVMVLCVCAVSSAAGGDVPPLLHAAVNSVVVPDWFVARVRGLNVAAAAAAAAEACLSRVYECHDLRRSLPDVADAASA